MIVWKRVTWQPVPTLLDPRPPPQTAVPMPSHMAPWAPQGWPSSPPIQPLLGTIMASYSGLAPVLRPLWRALNVPILTAHLILDPHQAAKHGAKDEMCRAGLCLPHIAASHISSRDEKGIVQCYISSSPTTLCKSFNVHRRPESSIPPVPISCLGCIWNIQ